jgi:hypothetical protein
MKEGRSTHVSVAPEGYFSSTDGSGSALSNPGCGKSVISISIGIINYPSQLQ